VIAIGLALGLASTALPACAPADLSLATDEEGGAFNGMSHSGTLLVLRNIGPRACTVPGLPHVVLRDAAHQPLPIRRAAPPGMHPGPVVIPVAVASGAELTAPLRWVSGPVYPHSRCYDAATLSVAVGDTMLTISQPARICGAAGKGASFTQPVLARDPVLP
jgi:hypothetical protein